MRFILFILLAIAAVPTRAEWVAAFKTGDDITFYIDPSTSRQSGNIRRVWELQDPKERGEIILKLVCAK